MDQTPTHLDLFSGIGGFALAAQWAGFRTIGFCEIDKYCQKVLAKNFLSQPDAFGRNGRSHDKGQASPERAWPAIISNIFDLDGRQFAGVSLITGGFPCQPFSVAGKRRGAADDRAIWPQMFRVISEARPAWVLGENVPGIIPMELDNVLSDLEGIGYATRPFVIPACAVDARHRRDRLWVVGRNIRDDTNPYSGSRCAKPRQQQEELSAQFDRICETSVSDTDQQGSQGRHGEELRECSSEWIAWARNSSVADPGSISGHGRTSGPCRWEREPLEVVRDAGRGGGKEDGMPIPESLLGRVAHGIPSRVDRLRGLGNAIVPQVAYEILREIRKLI